MFWKYNSPSSAQIEALLQQENVCLKELMDQEELLQECKAQNKKVIEFLIQPEILEELVSLLITDPSPDRELQVRFKYANLASELLTCDVPAIVDKVASSSNLLQTLYKFLEKERPLNPLLASFVSKVFGMLVQRRSEQNWYAYRFTCFQVLDFLKSQGNFVELAVKHIGTSAIMDLLSKLICGVDDDDQEIKRGIHKWLNDCHLIEQLIEKLTPDCDSEEHSSVDQLLSEIVSTGQDNSNNGSDSQSNSSQSELLTTLESKEMIIKLMDTLLHEERSESSVSHVINILLTLLSFKASHKQSNLHHTNSIEIINTDCLDSRSTLLRTMLLRLSDLQNILMQPTKLGTLMTSYGVEVERLGSTRLKVVHLIRALIATQDSYVHSQMASLHTLQLLFDLFFKFSLNNFLHTQVTECITCVVNQPLFNDFSDGRMTQQIDGLNNNPLKLENGEEMVEGDKFLNEGGEESEAKRDEECGEESEVKGGDSRHPLLTQLFTECNIIQKLLECHSEEENETTSTKKTVHNMVGYMGHLRDIANAIVQSSKKGPCADIIQSETKKLPNDVISQWEDFTLITLAEINLKNKIIPVQAFREGDMDNIGDMRFVDDFKETEDGLSGGSRLSNQMSDAHGMNMDDTSESTLKFEELCSDRNADVSDFDDIWKDRERNITFGALHKSEDDDNPHSSSEEEGDIDDEFDALRSTDEKIDVDFISEGIEDLSLEMLTDTLRCYTEWEQWLHPEAHQTAGRKEWTEVFDKRGNAINIEPSFNPWQLAPASETAENNSWADFGASPFAPSCDPFVQTDSQSGANFPAFSSTNPCLPSQPSGFQADFSNVLFSGSGQEAGTGLGSGYHADFGCVPSEHQLKDAHLNDPTLGSEPIQDVCDANKPVGSEQQNVVSNEGMEAKYPWCDPYSSESQSSPLNLHPPQSPPQNSLSSDGGVTPPSGGEEGDPPVDAPAMPSPLQGQGGEPSSPLPTQGDSALTPQQQDTSKLDI